MNITDSIFLDNNATNNRIIYSSYSNNLFLNGSIFENNPAKYNAGAMHINLGTNIFIIRFTFIDNSADLDGVIYTSGYINITNTNFTGNKANFGETIVIRP